MTPTGQVAFALVGCVGSMLVACGRDEGGPVRERRVVFVCEHGSAKSVIAAALFNARASERKLPLRAEARGITPDPTLMPAALAGLRADGLAPGQEKPLPIGRADADGASVIVAFDPLPTDLATHARVLMWDAIPPVSVDYAASRDAMLARMDSLLDDLVRE